uniref:RNA 3'-terminal phosphate cyclase domain-containing protein n=1 Tax=Quercus lobata TaxID=97700 RepID=A0A7N2N7S9_QUELO
MGKLQYKKMKGSLNLRQRLVLATLSSTPLLIEDIRAEHTLPGLHPHEISFLRLLSHHQRNRHQSQVSTGNYNGWRPVAAVRPSTTTL